MSQDNRLVPEGRSDGSYMFSSDGELEHGLQSQRQLLEVLDGLDRLPLFYPGAGRSDLLCEVVHYLEFSQVPVLLQIEDPDDSHSFLRGLVEQLSGEYSVCDVEPDFDATEADVLLCIAQNLGVNVHLEGTVAELRADIQRFLVGQSGVGPLTLIICKCPSVCPAFLFGSLQALLSECLDAESGMSGLRVLLVVQSVASLPAGVVEDAHYIALPGFSEAESSAYLGWWFEQADASVEEWLSPQQEIDILGRAGGSASKIRRLARKMLLKNKCATFDDVVPVRLGNAGALAILQKLQGRFFPWGHVSLLVILLCLLLVFFYRQPLSGNVRVSQVAPDARLQDIQGKRPEEGLPKYLTEAPSASVSRAEAIKTVVAPRVSVAPKSEDVGEVGVGLSAGVESQKAPAPEPLAPAAEANSSGENHRDVPVLMPGERFLMSLPADHYVLQVMGSSSQAGVEDFIAGQANKAELHWYASLRKGKPWFVVVAGNYANAVQAKAGIEKLPTMQKRAGPWPRALKSIQEEIEVFRGS